VHSDHLNTPRRLSDSTGQTRWQWPYSGFGEIAPQSTPASGQAAVTYALRYPGQVDDGNGLFYNWHRFYDPRVGRYTSADPIGLEGGFNRFAYVGGNPLGFVDPLGLWRIPLVDDFYTGKKIACLELEKQQWRRWLDDAQSTTLPQLSPSQWYVLQNAPTRMAKIVAHQGSLIGQTVRNEPVNPSKKPLPSKTLSLTFGMTCGCY
jgi:RHS repeat-associated protein